MDPSLLDPALEQHRLGRVHHRAGAADEPVGDRGRIADQPVDRLGAGVAVEHAVEQLDVLLLVGEEMIELEAAHDSGP